MPSNLEHVGILGMKWGHRKSSSNRDILGRSQGSPEHQVAKALKKKRLKDMTNEELRILTTRMQLERQYKDLRTSGNAGSAGRWLSKTLQNAGSQAASKYIAKGIEDGVPALLAEIKKRTG